MPKACGNCKVSDKANSPVRTAINRFLKLFIVEGYFSKGGVATPTNALWDLSFLNETAR